MPFFRFKTLAQVHEMMCPHVPFADALKVLEHENLVAWISFQQNIEHPKIVSIPIAAAKGFLRFAVSLHGLNASLMTRKEALLGITFKPSYADRSTWLSAMNQSFPILEGKVLFSNTNPYQHKDNATSEGAVWTEALYTPRRAKIIVSPGGLGPGKSQLKRAILSLELTSTNGSTAPLLHICCYFGFLQSSETPTTDTKRPIESILVGSVPMSIVDTGLYKTYRNLPMIWTFTYDEFYGLENRLVSLLWTGKEFMFEKLTYRGWVDFIQGLKVGTMTIDDW